MINFKGNKYKDKFVPKEVNVSCEQFRGLVRTDKEYEGMGH